MHPLRLQHPHAVRVLASHSFYLRSTIEFIYIFVRFIYLSLDAYRNQNRYSIIDSALLLFLCIFFLFVDCILNAAIFHLAAVALLQV